MDIVTIALRIMPIGAGALGLGGAALLFWHIGPAVIARRPGAEKLKAELLSPGRVPDRPKARVLSVPTRRDTPGRHLDVMIVIWVLALAVAWSVVVLAKANPPADQWSSSYQVNPAGDSGYRDAAL